MAIIIIIIIIIKLRLSGQHFWEVKFALKNPLLECVEV